MIGLLKYYIKKRAYVVGIITFIIIMLAVTMYRDGYIYSYEDYLGKEIFYPKNCPMGGYTFISLVLVTIVPLFEFSFKMRKVSVDEFYKFPIRREKLYLVKFIIGLMEIFIPMTVFFLFTLLDITMSEHLFYISVYIIFYLLSIPVLFAIYSVITFIYAKCNTIHDGLINVTMIQCLFACITYVIFEFMGVREICYLNSTSYISPIGCSNYSQYFFLYSPMTILANYGESFMEGNANINNPLSNSEIFTIVSLVFFFILGIVAFVLLIVNLKNDKSENSMDISNSWFSYKVMIPTFISTLAIMSCSSGDSLILLLIIAIFGYIGYAIYRRSFKIKLYDIVTMSSSLIGGIIVGAILWNLM